MSTLYEESFLPNAFELWESLAKNLYFLHVKRKDEIMQDSVVAVANQLTRHNNSVRWGRLRETSGAPVGAEDETIADIVARTADILSFNEKRRRHRIESGTEENIYYAWKAGKCIPNGPYIADEETDEERRSRMQRDAEERARVAGALREQNNAFLDSM